jgi:hypothetical protein
MPLRRSLSAARSASLLLKTLVIHVQTATTALLTSSLQKIKSKFDRYKSSG